MMILVAIALLLFFVLGFFIPSKLLGAQAQDAGFSQFGAAIFGGILGCFSWLGWWAGRKWLQHRASSRTAGPGVPDG